MNNFIDRCKECGFVFKKHSQGQQNKTRKPYKIIENKLCENCASNKTKDVKHGTTKASL